MGLKISPQNVSISELRTVWRIADQAGFDHLWAFDHLVPIFADPGDDLFEGATLLAAMAEATERVRIGLMVGANSLRHPALTAKIATTVDHLSGGRLEFGLGASGAEHEHTMFGIPFHSPAERIRRLDEALTICRSLWTEERTTFAGRFYALDDAAANPKPLQRPHPPIWAGAAGEQLGLRVVAEHADVWNLIPASLDDARRKAAVLERHCADVGRDPSEIRRSVQPRLNPAEPGATVDYLREAADAGFTENVVYLPPGCDPVRAAEIAAERILPEFRDD